MKLILFLGVVLFSVTGFALDITTLDGQTYKDVIVISVTPVAIDIGYKTKDNTDVVRGILFTNLPEDIRKKYGYSDQKAQKFNQKVKTYEKKQLAEARRHAVENAALQDAVDKDAQIYDNLAAVLYSKRLSDVSLSVIRQVNNGSVAFCTTEIPSVMTGHLGKVYVIGLLGGQGASWAGNIYPVGTSVTFEDGMFPVYAISIDTAINMILKDLKEKKLLKETKKELTGLSE